MMFLTLCLSVIACLVALPVIVFSVEILFSLLPSRASREIDAVRPKVAVLVPAHNEERGIERTLSCIYDQLNPTDRLIVIADNCDDSTVEISSKFATTVLERVDSINKGKGFALDYGVQLLAENPPDVVLVIDADCFVGAGCIDQLARLCFKKNRSIQALYLMRHNSESPSLKQRVAAFAWRVKNHARPLGLKALGLPCQLMGTGMAFPYRQLANAQLGSDNIVEDMLLGIELTATGHSPYFFPDVEVVSYFPEASEAEGSQRKRWEHGHLGLIVDLLPSIIFKSFAKRNFKLFTLAMDLAIPPLTLLASIVFLLLLLVLFVTIFIGPSLVLTLSLSILCLFVVSVFFAWLRYGRDVLSFRDVMSLPKFIFMKIPLYLQFIRNRQKSWERTERD